MKIHTLLLSYDKQFSANLEISAACSLYELAELSIKALGFDFDHAFGFYDNLTNIYCSKEKYTLFADMGESEDGEPGVKNTTVDAVFTPGKKMCFYFDYGDDWYFQLNCQSIVEQSSRRRARKIIGRKGQPPEQYPDLDEKE